MANVIVYSECPSPKTKEEYEALVQSMLAAVIAEEKNPDSWKPHSFTDNGDSGFSDILYSNFNILLILSFIVVIY